MTQDEHYSSYSDQIDALTHCGPVSEEEAIRRLAAMHIIDPDTVVKAPTPVISQDEHYMALSKQAADRDSHELDYLLADDLKLKASNPKDAISGTKVPMHLAPFTAVMAMAVGLAHGMLKYGRMNWRKAGVRASVYVDAIERHAKDYAEGNDYDEDGCCNLAAILANTAILVDARAAGKLTDDRNVRGADFNAFKKQMEAEYARLKELHADKNPKHYTIGDNA